MKPAMVVIGAAAKQKYDLNDDQQLIITPWVHAENSYLPKVTDLNFDYVYYFLDSCPNLIKLVPEEEDKLQALNVTEGVYTFNFINKALKEIRGSYSEIHIFDYIGYTNVLNFLYQTEGTFNDQERYYLNLNSKINWNKLPKPDSWYHLFSGQLVPKRLDYRPEESISELALILQSYLSAGFHQDQLINPEKLDYQLNLHIPEMEVFIRYFNLYPVPEDEREEYQYAFLYNYRYRRAVTITLAKVLAHYIVGNDLTQGDWLLPETYQVLIE